jgi:hypothetical protein
MVTDFIQQVIASASVSTILVGVLGWLTRSWISERLKNAIRHEYNEKLATHKAQLKAQSDIELEKLCSELAIVAAERQVIFTKLHEQRAEIVAETYALLNELHAKLGEYVKIFKSLHDKSKEERRKEVAEAHKAFITYYPKRKIFLPGIASVIGFLRSQPIHDIGGKKSYVIVRSARYRT